MVKHLLSMNKVLDTAKKKCKNKERNEMASLQTPWTLKG
jgi:hypothetical protein